MRNWKIETCFALKKNFQFIMLILNLEFHMLPSVSLGMYQFSLVMIV